MIIIIDTTKTIITNNNCYNDNSENEFSTITGVSPQQSSQQTTTILRIKCTEKYLHVFLRSMLETFDDKLY